MEVVTDKGWFLSSYRAPERRCVAKGPVTGPVPEAEDRRTSLDSGFSTESRSAAKKGGDAPPGQEDSGCGSMGGTESSAGSQTVYPLQERGVDAGGGAGRSGQTERVAASIYQSQSPSPEHGGGEGLRQAGAGVRPQRPSCVCSGAEQCSAGACAGDAGLSRTFASPDSHHEQQMFSRCSRKIQMDPVTTSDLETTFPLLTSLSAEMMVNFSSVPLSLCDVRLEAD